MFVSNGMNSTNHDDLFKILIVQSDPDVCEVLRDSLEAEGYLIETVERGRAAAGRLQQASYGTVLLDMKLTDSDGLTVLKTLRAVDPTLPVIILTGFQHKGTVEAAANAGSFAYMLMPYEPSEMKAVVHCAIAHRRHSQHRLASGCHATGAQF